MTFLTLPSGCSIQLEKFQFLEFKEIVIDKNTTDYPPSYIWLDNGQHIAIAPCDAFALKEWIAMPGHPYNTGGSGFSISYVRLHHSEEWNQIRRSMTSNSERIKEESQSKKETKAEEGKK